MCSHTLVSRTTVAAVTLYVSIYHVQGIALSADPNYKVLGAAYPWIARRLLTEQSPELRDTLRSLLYKKGRFQVHPCMYGLAHTLLSQQGWLYASAVLARPYQLSPPACNVPSAEAAALVCMPSTHVISS